MEVVGQSKFEQQRNEVSKPDGAGVDTRPFTDDLTSVLTVFPAVSC